MSSEEGNENTQPKRKWTKEWYLNGTHALIGFFGILPSIDRPISGNLGLHSDFGLCHRLWVRFGDSQHS